MQAIYFEEFAGPLIVKDLPIPRAKNSSVVIRVMATGLCRSDWHAWMGHDSDVALPHVPGHEFSGVISSVGSKVVKFKVNDRVTVPFVSGCGQCEFCLRGDAQVCPTQTQAGFTHFGSFSEYVQIHNADFNLIHLPDVLSFETAASLGCRFATSFRGLVDRAQVLPGEWVAIFGCGGVGLSAIMIAKALGAKVVAVDISPPALEKGKEVGADYLINSTEVDPVSEILQISGGVDVSVDALGSTATASAGINSLRRLGRHLQLGLLPSDSGTTALPIGRVIAYELTLLGSHGMAAIDYPRLLSMVASKTLHPELLVTSRISLAAGAIALSNYAERSDAGIEIINPQK
jgi:alcohol dehydrogenase